MNATLRDFGAPQPPSNTLRDTARFLQKYLDLDATALTDRAEAVLYGGRAATVVDIGSITSLRRELLRWRDLVAALYLADEPDPEQHDAVFACLLRFTPVASEQIPHVLHTA